MTCKKCNSDDTTTVGNCIVCNKCGAVQNNTLANYDLTIDKTDLEQIKRKIEQDNKRLWDDFDKLNKQ
jgi:transcription initiation factor TFIIIB Brf1 subunit/transcription initiation factor TFIIB